MFAVARDERWRSDFVADAAAAAITTLGFSPASAAAACSSAGSSAANAFASGTWPLGDALGTVQGSAAAAVAPAAEAGAAAACASGLYFRNPPNPAVVVALQRMRILTGSRILGE